MPQFFQLPKVQGLAGSKLYFYQTGTSTPQAVYTDEDLGVAHSQPVTADASGIFAPIYLDPRLPSYRVTYRTSADVLVYTVDDVPSNQNTSTATRIESTTPFTVWYDTDGTSGQRKFRAGVIGNQFVIQAGNEAENTWTTYFAIEGGVSQRAVLPTTTTVDDGSTEVQIPYPINGTFTGTLTGYASGPTGTVNYRVVSGIVTLWITSDIAGTSNANTLTMTGLPSAVQPTNPRTVHCIVQDNTQDVMGAVAVVSGSSITFRAARQDAVANYIQYSATGFTTSGTKGLTSTWTISYPKP